MDYLLNTDDYIGDTYIDSLRSSSNITIDSVLAYTTDFYKIRIKSKSIKKVFILDEPKLMSLEIRNYGKKELYLPEYFKQHDLNNNREMFIEIYKKKGKKFKKYVQKAMTTHTFFHPALNQNREIYETKKGKLISYEKMEIDFYKKIVDPGDYKVKIYFDLSNFGYFKILETDLFFSVEE
jgi:hypothetical protein